MCSEVSLELNLKSIVYSSQVIFPFFWWDWDLNLLVVVHGSSVLVAP